MAQPQLTMRVTVIAKNEEQAKRKAVRKLAWHKDTEFTPTRAYLFAPKIAPQAWYVEGYTK